MADERSLHPHSDHNSTLPHMNRVPQSEPAPGGEAVPRPAMPTQQAQSPVGDWVARQQGSTGPYVPAVDARRRNKRRSMEWAWVIVALALIGVTCVGSVSLVSMLRGNRETPQADAGLVAVEATAIVMMPTSVPNLNLYLDSSGTAAPDQAAAAGAAPADPTAAAVAAAGESIGIGIEPWDGQERFTILVMGWDRRPSDPADGAYRTDTMMLVSIDPVTQSVGILSIPRDLYVAIPGYNQYQRVNSAYVLGELRQPGYGAELAMLTVQSNLGVRVHDYLVVDFNTFITVVDAIGGIDIDNPTTINDPQYPSMDYGYDPFYLPAGPHHLDGYNALRYARTRHGALDFVRSERQQQVIMAIRDQVLNVANLPQLVVMAPALWANVSEGLRTGLTFNQILQLGWYIKDIPVENIHTGIIDERHTSFYTTARNEEVLMPDGYLISALLAEVFGPSYNQ